LQKNPRSPTIKRSFKMNKKLNQQSINQKSKLELSQRGLYSSRTSQTLPMKKILWNCSRKGCLMSKLLTCELSEMSRESKGASGLSMLKHRNRLRHHLSLIIYIWKEMLLKFTYRNHLLKGKLFKFDVHYSIDKRMRIQFLSITYHSHVQNKALELISLKLWEMMHLW